MGKLLTYPQDADTKLYCMGHEESQFIVHRSILSARSKVLEDMIVPIGQSASRKTSTVSQPPIDTQKEDVEKMMKENTLQKNGNVDFNVGYINPKL